MTSGANIPLLGGDTWVPANRAVLCGFAVAMCFTCDTRSPQIAGADCHNLSPIAWRPRSPDFEAEISGGVCRSAPLENLFPESASGNGRRTA